MFRRKKSFWSTRRDLHALLDAQGRDTAMRWWSLAEAMMKGTRMSAPAEFLAMTLPMTLAPDHDERAVAELNIAIRAGYALRQMAGTATTSVVTIDVSTLDHQLISQLADRPVDPETGFLQGDDLTDAASILRPTTDVLERYVGADFFDVVAVDEPLWRATAALATYQLHKNLEPIEETLVEVLLRYGFVLRAWEESLRINPDRIPDAVPRPPAASPEGAQDLQPDGAELDVERWISDATVVCTNLYEDFAELMLQHSAIELLGRRSPVDAYVVRPRSMPDRNALEAGISHARFGYALRNRETQVIHCYGAIHEGDPLAALAAHRAENYGVKKLVVHRLVRDVLDYQEPRELLYAHTPGTSPTTRRAGIEHWANHYSERDPRLDPATTTGLIEQGYFLHRLFEIDPSYRES
jgi:hypothetical protein